MYNTRTHTCRAPFYTHVHVRRYESSSAPEKLIIQLFRSGTRFRWWIAKEQRPLCRGLRLHGRNEHLTKSICCVIHWAAGVAGYGVPGPRSPGTPERVLRMWKTSFDDDTANVNAEFIKVVNFNSGVSGLR